MNTVCATRAIQNARRIREVAPEIFATKQTDEGFADVVPFNILQSFHTMTDEALSDHPGLLAARQAIAKQNASQAIRPDGLIFPDPSFKGTLYLLKLNFNLGTKTLSVSDPDMATVHQYLKVAGPAIAQYAAQYGDNHLTIADTIYSMTVNVPKGTYSDDTLRGWLSDFLRAHPELGLAQKCIVVLNPPGVVNQDGAFTNGILGYHDNLIVLPPGERASYCFVNVLGANLTVADRNRRYATGLSHEVAEMIANPFNSISNSEICDGCAGNCANEWLSAFSLAFGGPYTYLHSYKNGIPPSVAYDFYTAAITQPKYIDDCPVTARGCSYAPSAHADIGELLFYERPTGYGTLWSEHQDGTIALQTVNDWRTTWSLIVTGKFTPKTTGKQDVLFYSGPDARGEFYQSGLVGDLAQIAVHDGWRNDWSQIVPGKFTASGFSDLLFYEPSDGYAELYRSDGKGNIALVKAYNGFRGTWSIILAGNFSNNPFDDILFYDPVNGVGEIYATDGQGGLRLLHSYGFFRKTWSIILRGNFSGSPLDDLFFYDATNGVGEFHSFDGNGNLSVFKSISNLRTSWATILAGNFSGGLFDDLLFYDRTNGVGEFYHSDGKGNIALTRSHTDWRKTWSIVANL